MSIHVKSNRVSPHSNQESNDKKNRQGSYYQKASRGITIKLRIVKTLHGMKL